MNIQQSNGNTFLLQRADFTAISSAQKYYPWKMPCTLAGNELADNETEENLEETTADIPSVIGPDEPFDPDAKPEIDPAPPQPELPTPPAHPNIPPRTNIPPQTNVPPQPKDPNDAPELTELPPHISPIH